MMRKLFVAAALFTAAVASAQYPPTDPDLSHAPLSSTATMTDVHDAAITFDDVVSDWLLNAAAIRRLGCTIEGAAATCIFVPKFDGNKTGCATSDLDFNKCDMPAGQRDANHFCMVTDELSQVGLALAMHRDAATFNEWVNTIRLLLEGDPKYPMWNVRVAYDGTTASIASAGHDDASDATARIATALFIAASSSSYPAGDRVKYRLLADELINGLMKDFVDTGAGTSPRYWLSAGRNAAAGRTTPVSVCPPDCLELGYAGYYGDMNIALLAGSRGALRNRSLFLDAAADDVSTYLRAASFTSGFVVPPTSFYWTSLSGVHCVSCDTCNGAASWDTADAPRAISLCAAKYHAGLAGFTFPAALDAYCNAWLGSGGFRPSDFGYSRQYSLAGAPCNVSTEWQNLGLGAAMNFAYDRSAFGDRLGRAFHFKYDHSPSARRFDPQFTGCMNAYFPAFAINNFGMGIGRDRAAFQAVPLDAVTVVATASSSQGWSIDVDWTEVGGTYVVQRSTNDFANFDSFPAAGTHFHDTNNVAPNAAYAYRVMATKDGVTVTSNTDVATTFTFTDAITPGQTRMRAIHINEVRAAVNAFRQAVGLGTVGTAVVQNAVIKAADLVPLRDGLNAALAKIGVYGVPLCQSPLTPNSTRIRACDMAELRAGVR